MHTIQWGEVYFFVTPKIFGATVHESWVKFEESQEKFKCGVGISYFHYSRMRKKSSAHIIVSDCVWLRGEHQVIDVLHSTN